MNFYTGTDLITFKNVEPQSASFDMKARLGFVTEVKAELQISRVTITHSSTQQLTIGLFLYDGPADTKLSCNLSQVTYRP